MSKKPIRQTVEGRAYLDLKSLAASTKRSTDELLQFYALEGFLERLTKSRYADRFVLKGGMLLAAFGSRRPTRDVDLAGRDLDNDVEAVRNLVRKIVEIEVNDGLVLETTSITAQMIRDGDEYSGVRVSVAGTLATAVVHFPVDINVCDPISPEPQLISLPRLLGGDIAITGYPIEMVLSEKIVTALQRGIANTRWRDFVDIDRLIRGHEIDGTRLVTSLHEVAAYRSVALAPLAEELNGYSTIARSKWRAWRNKQRLQEVPPESFEQLLEHVVAFADVALTRKASGRFWNPSTLAWGETKEDATGTK